MSGILLVGSRISTIVRFPFVWYLHEQYRRRISLKIAGIDTRVDALRSEIYKTLCALAEHVFRFSFVSHFSYRLSCFTPNTSSLLCIFIIAAHNRREYRRWLYDKYYNKRLAIVFWREFLSRVWDKGTNDQSKCPFDYITLRIPVRYIPSVYSFCLSRKKRIPA